MAFQEGCDHLFPFTFKRLSHPFRNGGRGCQDLPVHLDVGRLRTGLAEGAPASRKEHVAILVALPSCGYGGMLLSSCRDEGMLLPCASLVPLHPSHLLFLWFLSLVLPATGERGARAVNS